MIRRLITSLVALGMAVMPSQADFRFVRQYPKIVLVGVAEQCGASGVRTVTLPTGTSSGDMVIVMFGQSQATSDETNIATTGYTELFDQGIENSNAVIGYKVMGSTVDTSVVSSGDNGLGSTGLVMVFRNVAAVATDAAATSTSSASGAPDSPSITTTRPEVAVITAAASHTNDTTVTPGTGYGDQTDCVGDGSDDMTSMMAWKQTSVTGAENPGAWSVSSSDGWLAVSLALRPIQYDTPGPPTLYRATCVSDDSNATTYNPVGWQSISITGVADTETVLVVVGVISEDSVSSFGVDSMTIDGSAAGEITDETGSGVVNTAIYTLSTANAASVNISVTHSEAVTSATVCVWAIKNLISTTARDTINDDDTSSGALVLTLDPTWANGVGIGICGAAGVSSAATWAVLTEAQDTETGEHEFSTAHTNAGNAQTTAQSMAVTCDWTNTEDASGAAAAWR